MRQQSGMSTNDNYQLLSTSLLYRSNVQRKLAHTRRHLRNVEILSVSVGVENAMIGSAPPHYSTYMENSIKGSCDFGSNRVRPPE